MCPCSPEIVDAALICRMIHESQCVPILNSGDEWGGSSLRSRSRSTQPRAHRIIDDDDDDDDLPGADEDLAMMARMRAQALEASRGASGIMEGEKPYRSSSLMIHPQASSTLNHESLSYILECISACIMCYHLISNPPRALFD